VEQGSNSRGSSLPSFAASCLHETVLTNDSAYLHSVQQRGGANYHDDWECLLREVHAAAMAVMRARHFQERSSNNVVFCWSGDM
jgi:hypothetical protein